MGHPDYLTVDKIPSIACSHTKESIDGKVQETQTLIKGWNCEVTRLRDQYSWLLYFSVPKMMLLYKAICSLFRGEEKRVDEIVHEVSFLMTNLPADREKLRRGVEVYRAVCAG